MFIGREKFNKLKTAVEKLKEQNEELQKDNVTLYTENTNLISELRSSDLACQDMHQTLRKMRRKLDEFDYKSMNPYSFIRGVKNELSDILEENR